MYLTLTLCVMFILTLELTSMYNISDIHMLLVYRLLKLIHSKYPWY